MTNNTTPTTQYTEVHRLAHRAFVQFLSCTIV
jgi:hypothetical protein